MAIFQPVKSYRFIPESYLPNVPYIPVHFSSQIQTYNASDFELELDSEGQTSILRLFMDDEVIVPYINLEKYDAETKDFFWYNPEDNFPYRFLKRNNTLENIYPTEYSGLAYQGITIFNSDRLRLEGNFTYDEDKTATFYKYSPLILTVNNRAYNDLSDYSNFRASDRLNKLNDTIPEFYYDFESRIYTNQNLAGIDPSQIKIHIFKVTDNKVKVKCRMSANSGVDTFYTPRVNHYIVKLKGQSLRA